MRILIVLFSSIFWKGDTLSSEAVGSNASPEAFFPSFLYFQAPATQGTQGTQGSRDMSTGSRTILGIEGIPVVSYTQEFECYISLQDMDAGHI